LSSLIADQATTTAHTNDLIKIGSRPCGRDEVSAVLAANSTPCRCSSARRPRASRHYKASISALSCMSKPRPTCTGRCITRRSSLSKEHQGPRAVLNALERLAPMAECDRIRQDSPLPSPSYGITSPPGCPSFTTPPLELTTVRDQLKAASGKTPGARQRTAAQRFRTGRTHQGTQGTHSYRGHATAHPQKQSSARNP